MKVHYKYEDCQTTKPVLMGLIKIQDKVQDDMNNYLFYVYV